MTLLAGERSVALADVATFIRGITFKPTDVVPEGTQGTVACMRTKNVQSVLDVTDVWSVSRSFVKREDRYLRPGDVLIASANSAHLVGRCCWVPALSRPSTFGGFVSVLRAMDPAVDARYLYWWFSSPVVQATLRTFGRQTTNIVNLDLARCRELRLPLPSLKEQRRIAEVLDRADALRAKRREALALLDDLIRSAFIAYFGRFEELGSLWPSQPLEAVADAVNDCPHSTPQWTTSGKICLRTSNLNVGGWNWKDRRYVSSATFEARSRRGLLLPGDIVLSREGTVGVAAIVPHELEACMGQRLVQVRAKSTIVRPEYLLRFLLQALAPARIRIVMVGSTAQHLNVKELRCLRIPLPPVRQQDRFAEAVDGIEALKAQASDQLDFLDSLLGSLQQRAFAGEL